MLGDCLDRGDGYAGKISSALPGPDGHMWRHLFNYQFGCGLVEAPSLAGMPEWILIYMPDADRLRSQWRAASSSVQRGAIAAMTSRSIRHACSRAYADLWQLAVTEQRIAYLVRAITGMLQPRPVERLRQAIHK